MTIRVLLVDDHPVVRAGLSAVLNRDPDIEVVAQASTGSEALELVGSTGAPSPTGKPVDVVVTDIRMPDMDGVELTRHLTESGGPPVLILTTFSSEDLIVAALGAGAAGYLLKDAPADELAGAVRSVHVGQPVLAAEVTRAVTRRVTEPHTTLSARELEIIGLVAQGKTNRDIASDMFISQATVKTHLVHVFTKLGVDNRTAAVMVAREQGLIE